MNLIILDTKVKCEESISLSKISLIAISPTFPLLCPTQLLLSYLFSTYYPSTYPTLLCPTLPHPAPDPIFLPIFILAYPTYPRPIYISIYLPTLPYPTMPLSSYNTCMYLPATYLPTYSSIVPYSTTAYHYPVPRGGKQMKKMTLQFRRK